MTTIVLQSRELELTRKELKSTRKELKRSASAQKATKRVLKKQSQTLTRQQFESTFFSLLEQHNRMLEDLYSPRVSNNPKISVTGTYLQMITGSVLKPQVLHLGTAKLQLERHNSRCGHYFRVLYQILKFVATNSPRTPIGESFEADKIKNEEVSDNEKMYSNFVRSFLGYEITQLLAINCYCKDDQDPYWKFRLLIERYAFLEHMPFEVNGNENALLLKTINAYELSAFGKSEFLNNYQHLIRNGSSGS